MNSQTPFLPDFLSSLKLTPPAADQLEICVFGSGYGESILVHLGEGKWIAVDSCIFRNTSRPAPLLYFDAIGVSALSALQLIVASHWDDDHILGLSEIVEEAHHAKFFMSGAISDKKFDRIVLASPAVRLSRRGKQVRTGVNEFNRIYHLLKDRGVKPSLAFQDKTLLQIADTEVVALAPHDEAVERSIAALKSLIPTKNAVGVISPHKPNYTSVVLLIRTPIGEILLGADMEESPEFAGWSLLLRDSVKKSNQGEVYKVAHHGSVTGHKNEVFTQLLKSKPISAIAPWQKGGRFLPTKNDLRRILSFSGELHLSAEETHASPKVDNKTARALKLYNAKSNLLNFNLIRLRKTAHTQWEVEHFGGAKKVESTML